MGELDLSTKILSIFCPILTFFILRTMNPFYFLLVLPLHQFSIFLANEGLEAGDPIFPILVLRMHGYPKLKYHFFTNSITVLDKLSELDAIDWIIECLQLYLMALLFGYTFVFVTVGSSICSAIMFQRLSEHFVPRFTLFPCNLGKYMGWERRLEKEVLRQQRIYPSYDYFDIPVWLYMFLLQPVPK